MKAAVCCGYGRPMIVEHLTLRSPRRDEVKVAALTSGCVGSLNLQVDIARAIALYKAGRYPLERINEALESSASGEVLRNIVRFE